MGEAVLLEKSGAVALITLNRADALNAINGEMREALPRAIRDADADPAIRVVVLRGAGPRAFCAGADIKEFAPVDSSAEYRQSRVHDSWIRAFDEARKPIVASIHGYCLGGGLEIALACDIRIAARDAVFGFPETGLGILTGVGGSQRIARVLGLGLALDLILTGERIGAERAQAIGLVSRLVEPDTLGEATRKLAETIAAKAPLATMFAKEAVRRGRELELSAGMRLEVGLLSLLLNTEDRLEAARAFKEKRAPRFAGR
jgi:enoyl-CoA hydratase/carnithine racemase